MSRMVSPLPRPKPDVTVGAKTRRTNGWPELETDSCILMEEGRYALSVALGLKRLATKSTGAAWLWTRKG